MNTIQKYSIKAKKSLGQNFLVDEEKLSIIGNTLELSEKNIVEVGPGYGALTEKLLEKQPKNLELAELDTKMVDILQERIATKELSIGNTNLEIKNIDVLTYTPAFEKYFVIANIPYYITSPILRHFFYDVKNTPEKMLILMQKDVGDKILLGTSQLTSNLQSEENSYKKTKKSKIKNSVLSLFLQKKSYIKEVLFVGKECFSPAPRVDSSVLLFERHDLYNDVNDKAFLAFIKLAFAEPRKKLSKNLAKKYRKEDIEFIFESENLQENMRPEEGSIDLYCHLAEFFGNRTLK